MASQRPGEGSPPPGAGVSCGVTSHRALEIVATVSRELAEAAFDQPRILDAVTRGVTEGIGDGCALHLITPDRAGLELGSAAHRDPAALAALRRLGETPAPLTDGVSGEVLRTGRPVLLAEVGSAELPAPPAPPLREYLARFPVHSVVGVPLVARGEALGTLVASRHSPGDPYGEVELRLLEELAGRAALAIAAAREHEQLRTERRRLDAVLLQMPSAVVIVEAPSGKHVLSNEQNRIIFRQPSAAPASIEDYAAFSGVHPDGRPVQPHEWPLARSLRTGEIVRGEEIEILRGDGTRGVIRINSAPIREPDGRITAGVVTYDDVTEQHLADARLRFLAEASKLLSSSLEYETTLKTVCGLAVPLLADWCAVEMVGADGVSEQLAVAHVDPAKVELAWELRRRYPPDPDAPRGVQHVIRTGVAETYPEITDEMLVHGTRDEEHLRISRELGLRSALVVPISTSEKTVGAVTLVSAGRRFGEADLALAEKLAGRAALAVENARLYGSAQEAIRHRDEFLSVASHELKTPLTSLSLHVTGLLRAARAGRVGELTVERVVDRLGKIDQHVRRLTSLIDELLDVSRIRGGRLHLEREEVDLAAMAREVVSRSQVRAAAAGCGLSFAAAGPVVGRWDRNRIDQVIENLVSNAIKYGAKAPVDVLVESTAGGGGRLTVVDRGIGIAPEDQARVFERFERAASPRNYGGMGLGLWIAKQIVDAHGGVIAVTSGLGAGATFVLELPAAPPGDGDA